MNLVYFMMWYLGAKVLFFFILVEGKMSSSSIKKPNWFANAPTFRSTFGNTLYSFSAIQASADKLELYPSVYHFPHEDPTGWTCEGVLKGSLGVETDITCVQEKRKDGPNKIKATVMFDSSRLDQATTLVFNPDYEQNLHPIPHLVAEKSYATGIPWAKGQLLEGTGFKQWAQCFQRTVRDKPGIDPQQTHSCLVGIGDGYPNPIEKSLWKADGPSSMMQGLLVEDLALHEISSSSMQDKCFTREPIWNPLTPVKPTEKDLADHAEPLPTAYFADPEKTKSLGCDSLTAVFHLQRFNENVIFLNSRYAGEGQARGCYCTRSSDGDEPFPEYSCFCRQSLDGAENLEKCRLGVYLTTAWFNCGRKWEGKVTFQELRVLSNANPVEFQTTLPRVGSYKFSDGEFVVFPVNAGLAGIHSFDLWHNETKSKCEQDKTILPRGFKCSSQGAAPTSYVDFVYSPAHGLCLRYLRTHADPRVTIAQYVPGDEPLDAAGVFGGNR